MRRPVKNHPPGIDRGGKIADIAGPSEALPADTMNRIIHWLIVAALVLGGTALAQERYSIFVGSEPANVERMLKLAELRDDDVVVDLGSGDGRIVLMAAQMNRRLRGLGVDLDPKLVDEANAAAKAQRVADRVRFVRQNAFDADLREATVIAMWLWPEIQMMLRPKILAEARPGTRVITNLWDLGSWPPDAVDKDGPTVSMWVVPGRAAGNWNWEVTFGERKLAYAVVLEQNFQTIEGVVRVGNRRGIVHAAKLNGEGIAFTIGMTLEGLGYVRHEFTGRIRGDTIEGTVRMQREKDERWVELPWRATRSASSAYFAPTGLDAK